VNGGGSKAGAGRSTFFFLKEKVKSTCASSSLVF
jgi:hypothetical protein